MRNYFVWFVILSAGLHLGTVRKPRDPITETQTPPIDREDKMKELAEAKVEEYGEKAAPAPSMRLYPKSRFLTDSPVEKEIKEEAPKEEVIPDSEKDIPEKLVGEEDFELDFGDKNSFKEETELDEASSQEVSSQTDKS